jgi:preprotein translocase subunit SecG
MTTVFLVIHLMVAVTLVTVILVQRSDGGALGGLGGGDAGGSGNFLSGRQSANLLTRTTTILATCFIATSLILAILASRTTQSPSILDGGEETVTDPIPYETSEEGPQAPIEE